MTIQQLKTQGRKVLQKGSMSPYSTTGPHKPAVAMGAEARGAKVWGSMPTPRAAPHRRDVPTPRPTGLPPPPNAAMRAQQPILTPRCPAGGCHGLLCAPGSPAAIAPLTAAAPSRHAREPRLRRRGRGGAVPVPGPGEGGEGAGAVLPPTLIFPLIFYFFFPFPSLSA